MNIQDKTKKELISELKKLQQENNSLKTLYNDISRLKKTELDLIASEIRYRSRFESAKDGILILDAETGKIVDVNPFLIDLLGFSHDQFIEKSIWEIGIFKDIIANQDKFIELKKNEYVRYNDLPLETKDGRIIHVEFVSNVYLADNQNVIQCNIRDITARMEIEKELIKAKEQVEESQQRLELFFAQSLDGFFFMTLDEPVIWNNSIDKEKTLDYVFEHQRMTKINSAMLEQYGAKEEQYIGLTPNDLFKHDIKHGRQVWKDFFDNGQLHIDTHENKFDGTDMIIEGDYICLYDSQKRITGHFGIQREVTDTRRNEEILQKSKSELEEYFENDISADYVVSVEGEIFSCNKTFLDLFGFEEKSHSKKFNITQLYKNPNDRKELIRRVKENGKVENYEVDFISQNGQAINAVINAIGIFSDLGKLIKIRGYVVDITNQKLAEKELRESEEKYHLLFTNNPQPMWIYDLETLAFLEVNGAAINHYGYSSEEFLSMTLKDIRPTEDIPALLDDIKNTKINLNSAGEWRHIKKSGEIIVVEINSHSVISNNRHARHVLVNDITERKRAESEILKLSQAVEQSPVSIMITNLDGNIEYVNPKFIELTGYSFNEVKGSNPRFLKSGEMSKEAYKEMWDTIQSKKIWTGEFHNKKKSGELYWEFATISPIVSEAGEIINYLAVKEDITERKKIEEELVKFKLCIERSFEAIFITDAKGNIIFINPAFEQMYGFSSVEAIGQTPRIFKSGSYTEDVYQYFWKTLLSKEAATGEIINKTKDGKLITIEGFNTSILDSKGDIYGYIGIHRDITERKRAESELIEAKEKAEESDLLKSAFLANMSHEIRTPMNGILGFAGLLKEPNLTGEQQQKYIQIIEKSGARMLNIINDIVSISKIESGILDIHLSETNINNQLQFVYDSLKLDADNKNLKLSFNCALPEKEVMVKTDSEKFYGIISNLVKNAIKYTDKGTIEFGYANKGEEFEFYVKDTGIGIPKDRKEAIFERFIQADIVDKMARQGAGLGLAISRAYVDMLGGKIWVESEEAKGSTFFFTLPCNLDSKEKINIHTTIMDESEAKPTIPMISGLKVLIAEDDETSEMLISIELEKFSKEILKVATGIDAIEICRQHPDIDLVLMDIQMPGMNGYEATRKIREFNKDVIIIAQTAYALTGDKEKAIEAGCNNYISKPIKQTELMELIQTYFRK